MQRFLTLSAALLLSFAAAHATVRTGHGVETIGFDTTVVSTGAWLNRRLRGIPGLRFSAVTPGTGYSFHVEMDQLPRSLVMGLHRKTLIAPMSGSARSTSSTRFPSPIWAW